MPKPHVETAALETPGGYRPTGPTDPPAQLVTLLADWLNRPEPYVLNLLAQVRFQHRA